MTPRAWLVAVVALGCSQPAKPIEEPEIIRRCDRLVRLSITPQSHRSWRVQGASELRDGTVACAMRDLETDKTWVVADTSRRAVKDPAAYPADGGHAHSDGNYDCTWGGPKGRWYTCAEMGWSTPADFMRWLCAWRPHAEGCVAEVRP